MRSRTNGGVLWSSLACGAAMVVFATASGQAQQRPAAAGANAVGERGKYLVGIPGCHDCHSPKVAGMTPDMSRALSGRPASTKPPSKADGEVHASLDLTAWYGPWGMTIAANLTPDPTTGLGKR